MKLMNDFDKMQKNLLQGAEDQQARQQTWRDLEDSTVEKLAAGAVLKPHPAADMFPMMEPDALRGLAQSILTERRLLHPILIDPNGQIVDGRNRLAALRVLGYDGFEMKNDAEGNPLDKPVYLDMPEVGVNKDGKLVRMMPNPNTRDVLAFVMALNLERRHLSTSQRRELNRRIKAAQGVNKPGGNNPTGANQHGNEVKASHDALTKDAPTQEQRATMLNVSRATIQRWDAQDAASATQGDKAPAVALAAPVAPAKATVASKVPVAVTAPPKAAGGRNAWPDALVDPVKVKPSSVTVAMTLANLDAAGIDYREVMALAAIRDPEAGAFFAENFSADDDGAVFAAWEAAS